MPVYPGTLQRSVDHGEYVLLMRARGKLRYHTAIFGMDILRGYHIAQQYAVPYHSRRRIIARRLYSQYNYIAHSDCKITQIPPKNHRFNSPIIPTAYIIA